MNTFIFAYVHAICTFISECQVESLFGIPAQQLVGLFIHSFTSCSDWCICVNSLLLSCFQVVMFLNSFIVCSRLMVPSRVVLHYHLFRVLGSTPFLCFKASEHLCFSTADHFIGLVPGTRSIYYFAALFSQTNDLAFHPFVWSDQISVLCSYAYSHVMHIIC